MQNNKQKKKKKLTWEEIRQRGTSHYKAAGTQYIELLRDVFPHPSLNALQVKALTDNIKYSYRMLVKGANQLDLDKINHYTDMTSFCLDEQEEK